MISSSDLIATNPIHFGFMGRGNGCDWEYKGIKLFHERTYFPWNVFKEITTNYWSETVYTNLDLAKQNAQKFNGDVEECFYCDENNKCWFLIFSDFDQTLKHALENIVLTN